MILEHHFIISKQFKSVVLIHEAKIHVLSFPEFFMISERLSAIWAYFLSSLSMGSVDPVDEAWLMKTVSALQMDDLFFIGV